MGLPLHLPVLYDYSCCIIALLEDVQHLVRVKEKSDMNSYLHHEHTLNIVRLLKIHHVAITFLYKLLT